MLVTERFELSWMTKRQLKDLTPSWGYGPFSEFIFFRTYARDGEDWADVIIRVIEGTFSIRKDHYLKNGLAWDEPAMQYLAHTMALSAFKGEWGPPGRGYWAMGTDMVYQRGSMALNNCGYVDIKQLSRDVHWAMDALMLGVGVGFSAHHDVLSGLQLPRTEGPVYRVERPEDDHENGYPTHSYTQAHEVWDLAGTIVYVVPDSREGWADAIKLLLESYEAGGPTIRFDYGRLRPRGAKIAGFGGEASGYVPLKKLHLQLRTILDHAVRHKDEWTPGRLITDVINLVGTCIVAGNVRRSATIALGHPDDTEFAKLKQYVDESGNPTKYWYRRRFGWMSNNSYALSEREHFENLVPVIAEGIRRNGEPGFLNLKAVRNYGRLGDRVGTELPNGSILRQDNAIGINPCGEIPLESYELCCLAEWYPTRCLTDGRIDFDQAMQAARYAAFYTQTVQLLMTHRPETNEVIARNRRTGVSFGGAATALELTTMTEAIKLMEHGYAAIREENKRASIEAGVPEAIRVTAMKPSGTTSLMMGVTPGAHWPTAGYMIRRARVDNNRWKLRSVLEAAGVPHEPDLWSANTEVYEFPVRTPGADRVRPVEKVSMWEQADFAAVLAQHFVDNAVSVTVTFDPMTRSEKDAQARGLVDRLGELAELAAQGVFFPEEKDQLLKDLASLQSRIPEGDDVERLVASYIGKLKSMSMLPRSNHGYAQAPEEAIDEFTYYRRVAALGELDWSSFTDQGVQELYCSTCETV